MDAHAKKNVVSVSKFHGKVHYFEGAKTFFNLKSM